jgi:hypothetical protein
MEAEKLMEWIFKHEARISAFPTTDNTITCITVSVSKGERRAMTQRAVSHMAVKTANHSILSATMEDMALELTGEQP